MFYISAFYRKHILQAEMKAKIKSLQFPGTLAKHRRDRLKIQLIKLVEVFVQYTEAFYLLS